MAESGEQNRLEQLRKQVAKTRALREKGVTFKVEDIGQDQKGVKAFAGDKQIGKMDFYPPSDKGGLKGSREVLMVEVDPEYRRQGVASSLFNEARLARLNPVHSTKLSSEGRAFVEGAGGPKLTNSMTREWYTEFVKRQKEINKKSGRATAARLAAIRSRSAIPQPVPLQQVSPQDVSAFLAKNNLPEGYDPFSGESVAEYTARKAASLRDPKAVEYMNRLLGRTANMGFGALNVAGFLPVLDQAGRIMQGDVSILPRNPYVGAMN